MFITFSLPYHQADYNVIKRIDSGALRFLYKLRVLILNDNLIPVLPAHLFRFLAKPLNNAATDKSCLPQMVCSVVELKFLCHII